MNEAEQRRVIAALAPSVQHDLNNMVTVTLATLDLMRHGLAPGDAALKRIERIDAATRRLDALMRGFLTLARAAPGVAELDVAALLHRVAPALRLAMGGAASLTIEAGRYGRRRRWRGARRGGDGGLRCGALHRRAGRSGPGRGGGGAAAGGGGSDSRKRRREHECALCKLGHNSYSFLTGAA